jgi:predicted amidohydrolase YtcJ
LLAERRPVAVPRTRSVRAGTRVAAAALAIATAAATSAAGAAPPGAAPPAAAPPGAGPVPADTVDARDSIQQALAVRAGEIVFVGTDAGLTPFIGPHTNVIDLHGRMLMPGLVDGHMHPLDGGAVLLKCSLGYAQITIAEMQARVQSCLDEDTSGSPDAWFEVVNWFQEGMRPAGTVTSRAVLDALHTSRPIVVQSSFGHTLLANSRALELAGLDAATPDPLGGRIAHDASGNPTGILEDAAQSIVTRMLPQPTAADDLRSARAALDAMRRQGITTFLDAAAVAPSLAAFQTLQKQHELTARAHFALLITPPEGRDVAAAVARVSALRRRYDSGPLTPVPSMTARNVKLFLDGVITAPACTGAMLEPYFVATGTGDAAVWVPGSNRGPVVYFPAPLLGRLLVALGRAGFEPHMHVDGDRAVHEGLDAVAVLRRALPGRDIRAALAHDEIVDPTDFPRYKALRAVPVLSMQWEKQAPDTVDGARDYLGPQRYRYMEPAGFLAAAGAPIAYGSDWPVDPLDEWFALKVGVTRTNAPSADPKYQGRLSDDPGLSRAAVLRAITQGASYELHQDRETGSLEVGKFADLIVLDRNVLEGAAEDMAATKVLLTVVGGRPVYSADGAL